MVSFNETMRGVGAAFSTIGEATYDYAQAIRNRKKEPEYNETEFLPGGLQGSAYLEAAGRNYSFDCPERERVDRSVSGLKFHPFLPFVNKRLDESGIRLSKESADALITQATEVTEISREIAEIGLEPRHIERMADHEARVARTFKETYKRTHHARDLAGYFIHSFSKTALLGIASFERSRRNGDAYNIVG